MLNIYILFYRICTLYFRGFQAYLRGAPNYNFPMYRQLVHEITETFKKISADIIDITQNLKDQNQNVIGNLIEQIQNEEQLKLELVNYLSLGFSNVYQCTHLYKILAVQNPVLKSLMIW